MARCLNTRPGGGHDNPDTAISCTRCDFLVQGAHIGGYEIISFIGAGSYGHVYKVREPAPLSRILALKVLRIDQFNEKALGSFFDEARRIADLQHPNILPVYNFGQLEDNRPYLVMEYAPKTIYDIFREADGSRRLAQAEELVPYLNQAADALVFVHNKGLIHQDVKPGNLLIGRSGQLLLSDFGTTFYLGMQTHASLGEATGTAAYMPPEQWQGNPRRDSDQYALAVCCYELLAGRTPFAYRRIEEMWNAHFRETPPSPQQWNRRIPVEVAAVILRGMAKIIVPVTQISKSLLRSMTRRSNWHCNATCVTSVAIRIVLVRNVVVSVEPNAMIVTASIVIPRCALGNAVARTVVASPFHPALCRTAHFRG